MRPQVRGDTCIVAVCAASESAWVWPVYRPFSGRCCRVLPCSAQAPCQQPRSNRTQGQLNASSGSGPAPGVFGQKFLRVPAVRPIRQLGHDPPCCERTSSHGPRSGVLVFVAGHRGTLHHTGMTFLPPDFIGAMAGTAISIKQAEQARLGAWHLAQSPSSSPRASAPSRAQYAAMARGTLARRPASSASLLASVRAWPVGWAGCGRSACSM